jgi:hypothetical protein
MVETVLIVLMKHHFAWVYLYIDFFTDIIIIWFFVFLKIKGRKKLNLLYA